MEETIGNYTATIEVRVDSHYTDGVVSMGTIVELFGMAGTKLAYLFDGDAGLMRAFSEIEFLAPVYHADYVQVEARLVGVGNTSRRRAYDAHVTARTYGIDACPTAGVVLQPPLLIARAIGTSVTPLGRQRTTPQQWRGRAKT